MKSPVQLLAIIGLGFALGTGHALVRTLVLGRPAIVLIYTPPVRTPSAQADPDQTDPALADPAQSDPDRSVDRTPNANQDANQEANPGANPNGAVPGGGDGRGSGDRPGTQPERASALDAPVKPGSITLRTAFELYERGAFFLDARRLDEYETGRIKGALWMPAARVITAEGQDDLNIIAPGDTVVIYCTGGDCDASENTAIRIQQLAFEFDIRILGMGYDDWVEAGLPIERSEDGAEDGAEGVDEAGSEAGGGSGGSP